MPGSFGFIAPHHRIERTRTIRVQQGPREALPDDADSEDREVRLECEASDKKSYKIVVHVNGKKKDAENGKEEAQGAPSEPE